MSFSFREALDDPVNRNVLDMDHIPATDLGAEQSAQEAPLPQETHCPGADMSLQAGVTTGKDPGACLPARQAPCTALCLISSGSKSRMPGYI